ncbi:MAG: hypothetical protein J0I07_08200 [Myxococcales bacterium]|nr:hypothetical protein [Myxococcales bacterium]
MASVLGVLALFVALLGCNTVPRGRMSVDDVTVRGAKKIDDGDVKDKIATTESEKLLGLFRGLIYEYSVFDWNVLQRDLARVEAFYRSKGYYEAHARAGRVHVKNDRHVRVEIIVEEGKPVLLRSVRIEGLEDLPKDLADIARRSAEDTLSVGAPFEEESFEMALGAVRRALSDRGYAYAKVENDATVDIVRHEVDVVLTVTPGEPCIFGPVTIEGLGDLPEAPVRRALDLEPGATYSEAELDSAQQALLDLGVFLRVSRHHARPARAVPRSLGPRGLGARRPCEGQARAVATADHPRRRRRRARRAEERRARHLRLGAPQLLRRPAHVQREVQAGRRAVSAPHQQHRGAEQTPSGGAPPNRLPAARLHRGAYERVHPSRVQRSGADARPESSSEPAGDRVRGGAQRHRRRPDVPAPLRRDLAQPAGRLPIRVRR